MIAPALPPVKTAIVPTIKPSEKPKAHTKMKPPPMVKIDPGTNKTFVSFLKKTNNTVAFFVLGVIMCNNVRACDRF